METTFFSSVLTETDYRIFGITARIISSGLADYVGIALLMYFTIELIKMMYLRQPMDLPNLLIASLIASGFFVYTDLAKAFDQEMNDIYATIRTVAGNANVGLAKGTYGAAAGDQYYVDTDGLDAYASDDDKLSMFNEFLTGNMSEFIHAIMSGLRKTMLLFLYAIGPVCMVFSMFPIFGVKVLKNWFFYLLNVHLWELGFIILQVIQSQIGFWRGVSNEGSGLPEVFTGNGWVWCCYNVTCFICFGMVPYLTSKLLIGISQPSSFGTRAIAATALVTRGATNSIKQRMQSSAQSAEGSSGAGANGSGGGGGAGGGASSMGKQSNAAKAGKMYGNMLKNFKGPSVS